MVAASLATLLATAGLAAAVAGAADPAPAEERRSSDALAVFGLAQRRRLQISTDQLLHGDHVHTHYTFDLNRDSMKRQGSGELWLSFAGSLPRMRWRGAARSPRFGDGEITVVVDPQRKVMHTLFKLAELHEAQCLTYAFPSIDEDGNRDRLQRMRERKTQVASWLKADKGLLGDGPNLLRVKWSNSLVLDFELDEAGKRIAGVKLMRGTRTVKSIAFQEGPDSSGGTKDDIFGPPAANCRPEHVVHDELAELELKSPHRKSSALNDLLLVLQDLETADEHWPRLFLLLCAITVPGDVAVMIEDPEPPDLGSINGVAFDYTAAVITRDVRHKSSGSIRLDLAERAFRLRGEAKRTRIGPLYMDLIALGGTAAKVYANVNLTVQEEQQCIAYDYPDLSSNVSTELHSIAQQGLSFYAISALNGDDCGIFVAPLARGRWIHIWVDLESEMPHSILRSEIHKSGQVIRSTDILRWLTADGVGMTVKPDPLWRCTSDPPANQLAHLGLNELHKRSLELQDALYALHVLDRGFAVLEILGLTGDVAVMVQEPDLPQLWKLPAISYTYSLFVVPADGQPSQDSKAVTSGAFAADLQQGILRMTARDSDTAISVACDSHVMAVRVEQSGESPVCLTLPMADYAEGAPGLGAPPEQHMAGAGIFDGVEAVGDEECNRFTFLGTGAHAENVELWFSKELDAVCRLSMRPLADDSGAGFWSMVNVKDWEPVYGHSDVGEPESWHCQAASSVEGVPWLSLTSEAPPETLPAAAFLAKLGEANGVVGLLPPRAANMLSRLVITPPLNVRTTTPAPAVDIFGPDLQTFSFSFTSIYPLNAPTGAAPGVLGTTSRHRGTGEVRVDLTSRKLFLRSKAFNVSAGVPEVESRVIFRGDRGRLYAYTKVGEDFEQCWSINTGDAVPPPTDDGAQPNPFARAKAISGSFSVPGLAGALATKHIFYLTQTQRVQLFVGGGYEMVAITVDDLQRDISTGIFVHDWSTAPGSDGWFETGEDWNCEQVQFFENAQHLVNWDMLRVFFPVDAVPVPGRRLVTV